MTIDELIQDLNIKKTAVYEDVQIATQIIDPLSALYFEGKLSRKAVLKFALFTDDIQKRIFETYPDKITTERVLQLSKSMKLWESIAEVFEDVEPEIRKQMYISAPKSMAQRVRKVSKLYVEDEDFRELCREAGKLGISVILDGVFSHTGADSVYFNKFGNFQSVGAYQSESSPYFDWFTFKTYPHEYDCWWGSTVVPTVNK